MNPPFNDARRHQPSPDAGRRLAHVAAPDLLDGWVAGRARLLEPGGALTLIWRADGLGDVLAALDRGFGGIAVMPVLSAIRSGGDPRAGAGGERRAAAPLATAAGARAQWR